MLLLFCTAADCYSMQIYSHSILFYCCLFLPLFLNPLWVSITDILKSVVMAAVCYSHWRHCSMCACAIMCVIAYVCVHRCMCVRFSWFKMCQRSSLFWYVRLDRCVVVRIQQLLRTLVVVISLDSNFNVCCCNYN